MLYCGQKKLSLGADKTRLFASISLQRDQIVSGLSIIRTCGNFLCIPSHALNTLAREALSLRGFLNQWQAVTAEGMISFQQNDGFFKNGGGAVSMEYPKALNTKLYRRK